MREQFQLIRLLCRPRGEEPTGRAPHLTAVARVVRPEQKKSFSYSTFPQHLFPSPVLPVPGDDGAQSLRPAQPRPHDGDAVSPGGAVATVEPAEPLKNPIIPRVFTSSYLKQRTEASLAPEFGPAPRPPPHGAEHLAQRAQLVVVAETYNFETFLHDASCSNRVVAVVFIN